MAASSELQMKLQRRREQNGEGRSPLRDIDNTAEPRTKDFDVSVKVVSNRRTCFEGIENQDMSFAAKPGKLDLARWEQPLQIDSARSKVCTERKPMLLEDREAEPPLADTAPDESKSPKTPETDSSESSAPSLGGSPVASREATLATKSGSLGPKDSLQDWDQAEAVLAQAISRAQAQKTAPRLFSDTSLDVSSLPSETSLAASSLPLETPQMAYRQVDVSLGSQATSAAFGRRQGWPGRHLGPGLQSPPLTPRSLPWSPREPFEQQLRPNMGGMGTEEDLGGQIVQPLQARQCPVVKTQPTAQSCVLSVRAVNYDNPKGVPSSPSSMKAPLKCFPAATAATTFGGQENIEPSDRNCGELPPPLAAKPSRRITYEAMRAGLDRTCQKAEERISSLVRKAEKAEEDFRHFRQMEQLPPLPRGCREFENIGSEIARTGAQISELEDAIRTNGQKLRAEEAGRNAILREVEAFRCEARAHRARAGKHLNARQRVGEMTWEASTGGA